MSSVIWICSVCIHVYGVDPVSVIFRSAFANDTQALPQASWYGVISFNSRSRLVFVQCPVINPLLLPFLQQEVIVLFHKDIGRLNISSAVFIIVYNWSGQQDFQISRQLKTYETRWRGTYPFSRHCHNHCRIAKTGTRCLGQSIAAWHSAPWWPFARKNTRPRCCQRGILWVLMLLFENPLLSHMSSIWSKFLIIYSCNDKVPVTWI